jgi:hypothetical protein
MRFSRRASCPEGSSEEDTLARAIANGDQKAITAALKSGKVQVKLRT